MISFAVSFVYFSFSLGDRREMLQSGDDAQEFGKMVIVWDQILKVFQAVL
jgi:hypothetical protein